MDSGFVFVAGTKTGVSLSVVRWLNKISPLILQTKVLKPGLFWITVY